MAGGLPSASLLENARFNALVVVPNALQGIFRRRREAVAVATRVGVDGHAAGLLAGMARSYQRRPVWVRVATDRALLMLDPADAARALEGSPEPFASDPPAKRDGMVAFQPEALTISRGERWRERRRFTEAALDTGSPSHRFADRFAAVCVEECERLATGPVATAGGRLGWDDFHAAIQRIARRVILGDGAAEATGLSRTLEEMMAEANGMPGEPSERLGEFTAALEEHLERAEEGSLTGLAATAPAGEHTAPAGQLPHWLFALGDTLAINALRALAVLGSDAGRREWALADGKGDRLEACLQEAMRLWPTTPMLSRETTDEVEWNGEAVAAGTQILIVNVWAHRDRDRFDYADRFAPEEWLGGEATSELAFNHFSRGPQGCPGAALALLVGRTVLADLLARGLATASPDLDPGGEMPAMLDFFGIGLRLGDA